MAHLWERFPRVETHPTSVVGGRRSPRDRGDPEGNLCSGVEAGMSDLWIKSIAVVDNVWGAGVHLAGNCMAGLTHSSPEWLAKSFLCPFPPPRRHDKNCSQTLFRSGGVYIVHYGDLFARRGMFEEPCVPHTLPTERILEVQRRAVVAKPSPGLVRRARANANQPAAKPPQ